MEEIRIILDENDFKTLVSGKILEKERGGTVVKIALQDIGFFLMYDLIEEQERKMNYGKSSI
jgi:hypothetical protein